MLKRVLRFAVNAWIRCVFRYNRFPSVHRKGLSSTILLTSGDTIRSNQIHGSPFLIIGCVFPLEANPSLRFGRRDHQLANGIESNPELVVVFLFEETELPHQVGIGSQHPTMSDKRPHDRDICLHSRLAIQNSGEHGYSLFCEYVRLIPSKVFAGRYRTFDTFCSVKPSSI